MRGVSRQATQAATAAGSPRLIMMKLEWLRRAESFGSRIMTADACTEAASKCRSVLYCRLSACLNCVNFFWSVKHTGSCRVMGFCRKRDYSGIVYAGNMAENNWKWKTERQAQVIIRCVARVQKCMRTMKGSCALLMIFKVQLHFVLLCCSFTVYH